MTYFTYYNTELTILYDIIDNLSPFYTPFNENMDGNIDIYLLCEHNVINENRLLTNYLESRYFQSMKEQWTMTTKYLH